jgi:hypothetical protein
MIVGLGCIVEGDGEKHAAPKLLARIASQFAPDLQFRIPEPYVVGRNKLVKPGELERTIELVVRRLPAPRGIFILIDADDDCPAILGPQLLARAEQARPDVLPASYWPIASTRPGFSRRSNHWPDGADYRMNCRRFPIRSRFGERNSDSPG